MERISMITPTHGKLSLKSEIQTLEKSRHIFSLNRDIILQKLRHMDITVLEHNHAQRSLGTIWRTHKCHHLPL